MRILLGTTLVLFSAAALASYHPDEVGLSNSSTKKLELPTPFTAAAPTIHHRPKHIEGKLSVGGLVMDFGSGGHGWSIPLGVFPITPSDVGDWGAAHHAIGINSNEIEDKELGRTREGIEIHAADSLASAGCVVVLRRDFKKLKDAILGMIADFGHAYLHIGPNAAAITPTDVSPLTSFVYAPEPAAHGDEEVHHAVNRHRYAKHDNHHHHSHRLAMRHHHHLATR